MKNDSPKKTLLQKTILVELQKVKLSIKYLLRNKKHFFLCWFVKKKVLLFHFSIDFVYLKKEMYFC